MRNFNPQVTIKMRGINEKMAANRLSMEKIKF